LLAALLGVSSAHADPVEETPAKPLEPPVAPAAQPVAEDPAARDSEAKPRTHPPPLIVVGVEPTWEGRYFRHTEFTSPTVRSYDANGYASVALAAELFPFVTLGSTLWRGLGVTFRYEQAFGFDSDSTRLGAPAKLTSLPVDTSFSRYAVGLRYRISANGDRIPLDLAGSASLCGWNFDF
jgi:hypothetical protein